jgi:SHS2 domain-containing protein
MRKYRLIDHTADFGLEVWGRTLPDLYMHAAEGMCTLLFNLAAVQPREERLISAQGYDPEEVLVDWLRELLYMAEMDEFLARRFEVLELTDTALRAKVWGETFDPERHFWGVGIKAVTYHALEIERTSVDEWRVEIIFDT